MSSNHDDEGFEALLKPIQDLTRNWEVDLSLHLEEYINYIRQICGDNLPDMNFAQAAVLVQNSANIYSKKVDFLFTTVLQLLDTLTKKQDEAKSRESQDEVVQATGKRRKAAALLETEEFISLDDVCSDRVLTLNIEKEKQKIIERKKQKIVLNAAIKVKAKEKTSCNVYHCGQDVMGKKDEFRLNWRICSLGTLHEEFVINSGRFRTLEPIEITMINNDYKDHDYSNHNGFLDLPERDDDVDQSIPPLQTLPATVDRESEDRFGELRNRKEPGNTVDIKEIEWQPNDFNANITEKPTKKRKVVKTPLGLENDKKRKGFQESLYSFTVTDVYFDQYKNLSFNRDLDFCYQSKIAASRKRQLLLQHRLKYQAYCEKEAGIEQVGDFHGFYNEEHDSDNEHDFEGFDMPNEDAPEVDIPLPDSNDILQSHADNDDGHWKDGGNDSYRDVAIKRMQEYRTRRVDHTKKTDLARRVEEWHKKILPKLEAEEKRSSFDIHAYGSKILNAFSEEIGRAKTFAEIVAGQPKEEVARYFLAVLLLANQNNVRITRSEKGDLVVDCVVLTLLSVVRHHEELDDNLRQTSVKSH